MSYTEAKKRHEQRTANAEQATRRARTDYRCRANGCPNTGCLNDGGESHRGLCWWHFSEPDARQWDAVTHRIRSNFASMRNHNEPLPADYRPSGDDFFDPQYEHEEQPA